MFWELEKAIFRHEKDKWWIRGSKTPKPPEMPLKPGETSQHHNRPRYMDCPEIGPKSAIKQGKKRQKDKWYLFRAPTPPPLLGFSIKKSSSPVPAPRGEGSPSPPPRRKKNIRNVHRVLNRPFFLGDTRIWRLPSVLPLAYRIWRYGRLV